LPASAMLILVGGAGQPPFAVSPHPSPTVCYSIIDVAGEYCSGGEGFFPFRTVFLDRVSNDMVSYRRNDCLWTQPPQSVECEANSSPLECADPRDHPPTPAVSADTRPPRICSFQYPARMLILPALSGAQGSERSESKGHCLFRRPTLYLCSLLATRHSSLATALLQVL